MRSYIFQEIKKDELRVGLLVEVLVGDNEIVRGKIKNIKSKTVPKDKMIKVELRDGTIGKVIKIVTNSDVELENFKFFNILFFEKEIYSIFNTSDRKYQLIKKEVTSDTGLRYLFIFSNKQDAENTCKKINDKLNNCKVTKLNMSKKISENFKYVNNIDYIIINNAKKVSFEKFKQLENEFRNK